MIELYIDNQQVVLPANFSLEIINENPFFTKNGQYTYDLTLSLDNSINAKLYEHYNRNNNSADIVSGRSARLIVDNKVLINGTEVILEITDKEVKIQLISGESELNYFIGGDKKLNSLDLGSFNVLSSEESGVFLPVFSSNEEKIYNQSRIVDYNNIISASGVKSPLIQPKLSFFVKRVINLLGYGIETNVFDSSFLQYIRILNGRKTVKYSLMLPDWTVAEFFTELENIFNIAFIIDEYTKKISIFFKNNYYQDSVKTFVDEVIDEFSKTIDKENKLSYEQANIGYELTDDEYFKYQKLEKMIIDRAQPMAFPSYAAIGAYMMSTTDTRTLKNKIFKSESSETQYICTVATIGNITYKSQKKVNIFKDIMNNPNNSDLDISLKIIPAPIRIVNVPVYDNIDANTNNVLYNMLAPLPVIETDEGDDLNYILPGSTEEEDFIDIQSILENDSDAEEEPQSSTGTSDNLFIFLYNGRHDIFSENYFLINNTKKVEYPIGFVDYLCEDERFGERYLDSNNLSLRLDSDHGLKPLFESISVDTTKEYTFKFIYNKKLDAKSVFVFNNKKFVCKQLKYSINSKGIENIIEGVFYPID
ncbi:hypothetical protein FACS1894145_4310 [Bacteroidia bacterium]|nr:hypothetical protein FACS1894145_4310 [Bacteroidia bacterium]